MAFRLTSGGTGLGQPLPYSGPERPKARLYLLLVAAIGLAVGCYGLLIVGQEADYVVGQCRRARAEVDRVRRIAIQAEADAAAERESEERERRRLPRSLTDGEAARFISFAERSAVLSAAIKETLRQVVSAPGQRIVDPSLPLDAAGTAFKAHTGQYLAVTAIENGITITTYYCRTRAIRPTYCKLVIRDTGEVTYMQIDSPAGRTTGLRTEWGSWESHQGSLFEWPKELDARYQDRLAKHASVAGFAVVAILMALSVCALVVMSAILLLAQVLHSRGSHQHYAWSYATIACVIAVLHFSASMVFLLGYYDTLSTSYLGPDGPDEQLALIQHLCSFPGAAAEGHFGMPRVSRASFSWFAAGNAIIWGACGVNVWNLLVTAYGKCKRRRKQVTSTCLILSR